MTAAIRILCVIAICFFSCAASGEQQKVISRDFGLSFPTESWELAIDLPGFTIDYYGLKPDGRLYFYAEDRAKGVIASVTLERKKPGVKYGDCDSFLRDWTKGLARWKPIDVRQTQVGSTKALEYTVPEEGGQKIDQRHLLSCVQREDAFIDVHVSKIHFQPGDETLIYPIIESLRIRKAGGSTDSAITASTTKPKDGLSGESLQELANRAGQGDTNAMLRLGRMYESGDKVRQDFSQASEWYRKAVKGGDPEAMVFLAIMHLQGRGVEKDSVEGIRLCRLAAEKGSATAMFNLGFFYDNGVGVQKDYAEAVRWYRLAADKGQTYAMSNLGRMYENGYGVQRSYEDAAKWYASAAKKGDVFAMDNLGNMAFSGPGSKTDYGTAAQWYHQAAMLGFTKSMRSLARMFHDGKGVQQDYGYAYAWAELAMERLQSKEEKDKVLPLASHMAQELRNPAELDRAKKLKKELALIVPVFVEQGD
jgi:TPR repeat protein